ncbi:MAG: amidohydrolase family protein [Spirochaetales bacterium]|nr:amidohydrolase family protein [Spirochaetales bacterium]
MDESRRVLRKGFIGIQGTEIVLVDSMDTLPPQVRAEITIDAEGMVMLPGLIDTHAHGGHGLTKTLGEGGVGIETDWDDFMEGIYFRGTTPEFWYEEARLSGLEKLKFGVTTGMSMLGSYPRYDDQVYWRSHVEGMAEIGIRDILGIGTPNPPFPKTFYRWIKRDGAYLDHDEYQLSHEESFEKTRQAVRTFQNTNGGLTFCYPTPSGVGRRDPLSPAELTAQNRAMKDISLEFGVPVHAHSYGGDLSFAREHFPFILSPDLSLAHCTGIDEEEIKILADTGVGVCSGPSTGSYIKARCPVVELLEAGCTVSFCTDASAPDRTFDLFEKLRMGARLHRVHFHDNGVLPAGKLLEMVTIDAARCLGLQSSLGSLEPGKLADLILVDTRKPHLAPVWQEPLRMVYQASGHDVDTVVVNGKILMRGREVSHINQQTVLQRGEEEAWAALRRLGLEKATALPEKLWGVTHY